MVDFSNLRTFPKSYGSYDNFLCIKQFIFFRNGTQIWFIANFEINQEKTIIMIKHLEVTSNYLLNPKCRNWDKDF